MGNIYTVAQVNSYIKSMFTQDFLLNSLAVKGEISNTKYHSSGHVYFTLKDEKGTMNCVMFASYRQGLSFRLEEGLQVVVRGNVDVYERDGKYQLYAKEITLEGTGQLYEEFERLKRKLDEMGMFSTEYKMPIPRYIKTLGVITAPTGAAVRDIITVASRRNPFVQIILYPAIVQGDEAVPSIVRGLKELDERGVDVIIVGRGGGSIEDLWAFNSEQVADAIFHSQTPVISAVGHETDTTIADFVSDLRAPTPSAAAEMAVYEFQELEERLSGYEYQLKRQIRSVFDKTNNKLDHYKMRLQYLSPENKIREKRTRVIKIEEDLQSAMEYKLLKKKHQLELYIRILKGLSPLDKLNQGLSYVSDENGKNISSISQVEEGDEIHIDVKDGCIFATVTDRTETRR